MIPFNFLKSLSARCVHAHQTRRHASLNRRRRQRTSSAQPGSVVIDVLETRTLLSANPISDQFVVNETTSLEETPPSVAVVESTGDFVAAWTSFEQGGDASGLGVYVQQFNADGTPKNGAFLVNAGFTEGDQTSPAVAANAAGGFIVVWTSQGQDGDGFGIYAQRYTSAGLVDGAAFKVNEFTAGDQSDPTVAMDNDGNFVVAWQSEGQDGEGLGVYARRYNNFGIAQEANEFLVNATTVGDQFNPTAAAARGNGNFVIAWEGQVLVGEESVEVFAHVYESDGSTIRGEFQVNSTAPRDQVEAAVAMDADGDFVVAWTSEGQTGSGSDVFAQIFDETGAEVGGEFRVNETTLQGQRAPAVAIDDDGDFVVAWQSSHQDEFSWGIFGRTYDASGLVLTPEFQVNTYAADPQTMPAISANSEGETVGVWLGATADHVPAIHAQRGQLPDPGVDFAFVEGEIILNTFGDLEGGAAAAAVDADRNFVVVWESYSDDGSGLGILGRRFNSVGDPLGDAFIVNTTAAGNQSNADVAMDFAGNFVVVWESADQDGDGHGIFAQRFDAAGNKVGVEFQVNTTSAGSQSNAAVAMNKADGSFVVTWQGPDANLSGIYARRFHADGTPVGDEFQVNTFEYLDQVSPTIDMNTCGQFAIAWVSDHRAEFDLEDSEKSIFVQWYDENGNTYGDEVLAHTIVEDAEAQEYPDIALDSHGNFVLVWQSITQDGSAWGVYARQFRFDKTPVHATEFQINQTTEENQRHATVVSDPEGNFTVAWQSDLQDQSATAIMHRQYNADGTPETDEMRVNTWELGPQILPVMAMTPDSDFGVFWLGQGTSRTEGVHGRIYEEGYEIPPPHIHVSPIGDQYLVNEAVGLEPSAASVAVVETTGNYVVAWTSFEQEGGDTSGLGVYVQRFFEDGTPNGVAMLVNTAHTADDQQAPMVAVDAAGNFIVVWESLGQDGSGAGIYAQRYLANGTTNGAAFKVNEVTAGDQQKPVVAMDNAGNFIIAWQSLGQDGDGYGIYARQYDNTGTPQTLNEFLVNTSTDGNQTDPTIAAARDNGQFVVVWQGEVVTVGEEGEELAVEIFARLFDVDGNTLKAEFQVNSISDKDQVGPAAAMDADGDFVIAWTTEGLQGSGADVFARRFNAAGGELGDDFKVNFTTQQGQEKPSVAMDGDGDFLITWQSSHQDGFSWGVFARAYDSDGNIIVDEFQVNSNTQGPQTLPMTNANSDGTAIVVWLGLDATHVPSVHGHRFLLPQPATDFAEGSEGEVVLANYVALEEAPASTAVDANRNFVTVWQSYGEDGSGLGLFGRQFDADGNPKDVAFQVNTTTDGNQSNPSVASDADGNFVVVWQAIDQDGDGYGIFGRRYAADGIALSGEFQINSTTAGDQTHPTIAMNPTDGSFVVFWQGPDAELTGIYMQRFEADGDPIGGEELVNTFTDLGQYSARAAMNASGEFVVAWVSDHRAVFDPNDTEKSVFVQWFDADGNSTGDEVLVHSIQAGLDAQEYPDVAIDANGNFIVVWQSINQDGNTWGVFGRQFLADKTPIQNEFQINQTIIAPQRHANVDADPEGNFVVAWQSHSQDSSGPGVYYRVYDHNALPQSEERLIPTADAGPQSWPIVAMAPNGDFGIVWIGHGVDRVEGVHGRIFEVVVAPDLVVKLSDAPTAVERGDTVVYTLSYENIGNADATGVVITESLPEGTTFNAAASTPGWVDQGGGVFTFDVGALAAGSGVQQIDFAVTVDLVLNPLQTTVSNTASIADDGTHGADPVASNSTDTEMTALLGLEYLVQLDCNTLQIFGTSDDDVITISLGAEYIVNINGDEFTYDPMLIDRFEFDGMKGNDSLHITGTPDVDSVTLHPKTVEFLAAAVSVGGVDFESIQVVSNGGNDVAYLYDSLGDDEYRASPTSAKMQGPGYANQVDGFRRAYAYSYAGGVDVAYLDDSSGNDRFVAQEVRSWMTDDVFYNSATRFDRVYGYAYAGGLDRAYMYDTTGNDRFVGREARSIMLGDSYYASGSRFEQVYAYANNGGQDRADLYASAANDKLVSSPTLTKFADSTYSYQVSMFEVVNAYGGYGGTDTATVTDSAGNDSFLNTPTASYMTWGTGQKLSMFDFNTVDVTSLLNGTDVATFKSLSVLDDIFGLDPLAEVTRSSGRVARVTAFDEVVAESLAAPGPSLDMTSIDYIFTQTGVWS